MTGNPVCTSTPPLLPSSLHSSIFCKHSLSLIRPRLSLLAPFSLATVLHTSLPPLLPSFLLFSPLSSYFSTHPPSFIIIIISTPSPWIQLPSSIFTLSLPLFLPSFIFSFLCSLSRPSSQQNKMLALLNFVCRVSVSPSRVGSPSPRYT